MARMTPFSSPLMLGFDTMEKTLERIAKSGDGYPPYNIERIHGHDGDPSLRITLAVAGFAESDLEIAVEDNQLVVTGRNANSNEPDFLHQGIASRQFQRSFMLAEGLRVVGASLKNGLLTIDIDRPEPKQTVRKIKINADS